MKNYVMALSVGLLSVTTFAQKNELKAIEKALKNENLTEAKATLATLEPTEDSMDTKYKAHYYLLKGDIYGKEDVKKAADAYKKLFEFEKEIGKQKYTKEAQPKLTALIQSVSNQAINQYNDKDYTNAKKNFLLTYQISPADTTYLYNAALSATIEKDYETALEHYLELKKIGYTGITTQYFAVNKESKEVENLGSKENRDTMVKFGQYTTPTDEVTESKSSDIIKNIGYIYVNLGKPELAINALEEARKESPKDVNLILNQAQMYIQLKKMDDFARLMTEAVEIDPTNPSLFFNLGVINQNQGKTNEALDYYKKAIELKPDYSDAYLNMAIAILGGEKAIVEEMNKNLSNEKKYNELQKKQRALYKEALPFLEKADELERSLDTVRTLLNIYDTLEMTAESDKLRPIYLEMRDK